MKPRVAQITPTLNKTFIKLDDRHDKTESGLQIVSDQIDQVIGEVVAIGYKDASGVMSKIGDRLLINKYATIEVIVADDGDYAIVPDRDILAVIAADNIVDDNKVIPFRAKEQKENDNYI